MERPRITLEKSPFDLAIETATFFGVLILISLPLIHYTSLPDIIPTHFNSKGMADGYGSKGTLLLLPIIGTVMCIGLYALTRFPHIFNYPVEITAENAEKHYRNGTGLIRWLNLIIVTSLCFIEWRVIAVATQGQGNLGPYFMPVFLGAIFGTIGIYLWKSRS